jgi:hypothetical protein
MDQQAVLGPCIPSPMVEDCTVDICKYRSGSSDASFLSLTPTPALAHKLVRYCRTEEREIRRLFEQYGEDCC